MHKVEKGGFKRNRIVACTESGRAHNRACFLLASFLLSFSYGKKEIKF